MRRKFYLLLVLFLGIGGVLAAQNAPQGFNYQAIVRNNNGDPLANQTVTLLFAIRSGSPTGPVSYSEKQVTSTNEFGLVNLVVGQGGTVVQGTFAGINWGASPKYLAIALETSPNVYNDLGTTQLLSVPFALYAQAAASGSGGDNWGSQVIEKSAELKGNGTAANPLGIAQQGAAPGQVLKWNGTTWLPQDDVSSTGTGGGTVTQINTGAGLTGGPITSSGTIALDNTGVTAGTYGNSGQVPVITVDAHGRVTSATAVNIQGGGGSITLVGSVGIDVQQIGTTYTITNTGDLNGADDLTLSSQAAGDVTGPFSNLQINAGAVGNSELADDAVTGPKIADGAVNTAELADNAVTTGKIADGAVNTADLADNAVTSGKITDNAVTTGKIADGAVNTADLADNAVTTGKIADGAVSTIDLADNAVNSLKIVNNAVTTAKLADASVTATKLSSMGASNGQVIKWNATLGEWEPANDNSGGGGSVNLTSGTGISVTGISPNYTITNTGDVNATDDLTNTSQSGGDLTGPFANLQIKGDVISTLELADNAVETANVANGAITGAKIAQAGATTGQVLKWSGSTWAPAADNTGGGGTVTIIGGVAIDVINNGNNNYVISNSGDIDPFNDITENSPAGGDLSGTFNNLQLNPFVVTNAEISNNAVNTNNLINGAVTGAKIAQGGATTGQVMKWNGTTWAPATDQVGVGDNWGTQTASTDATLTGNGTGAMPLKIAQQGATSGKVLKWNGTTWAPADDIDTGDNWGTQTTSTDATLTGNGTGATPLKIAQQGATNGKVLKWNGTTWAPADDIDTGDNWGTQTASVDVSIAGNGTAGNPLKIAQQGAVNGKVLKWNGSNWAPADDIDTGDNWGTQTAVTDATLSGLATAGTPLKIAQQGASSGQVLKWNGTTWAPANDIDTGDNWGAQTVLTDATLSGNGAGAVLKIAQNGANTGEILKWDGSTWVPSPDLGSGTGDLYAAGTGISITGIAPNYTINNTGDADNDASNELQSISLAGSLLTLSDGGGTVTLPSGNSYSGGVGISVTGSAPNFTITNTGDLSNANELQTMSLVGNSLSLSSGGGTVTLPNYSAGTGINITGVSPNFVISNNGDDDDDPFNELQTINLVGNNLTLSDGGGTVALPSGNSYTAGAGITITGSAPNFTVANSGDLSNTNELQTISLAGTDLTLSNGGGTVDLSGLGGGSDDWDPNGSNIFNNNSGSVLIGANASPGGKLHVKASSGTAIYANSPGGNAIIAEEGRTGLGTLTPATLLHAKGTAEIVRVEGNNAQMSLVPNGASTGGYLQIKDTTMVLGTSNAAYDIVLAPANLLALGINSATGNVGIGLANDGPAKLKVTHGNSGMVLENVNGHNWEMWVDDGTGNLVLYNDVNGVLPAGFFATNGVYTASDRRLKKDISPLSGVTNRLLQLQPIHYRMLQEKADKPESVGFIAQEVQALFPELTNPMSARDGNTYLAVNYAGFSVIAVKAIQEQQAEIEKLKLENEQLRQQLQGIDARLKKLER